MNVMENKNFEKLENYISDRLKEFDLIEDERKSELRSFAGLIKEKANEGEQINLNFICTHNSRRSHLAQIWAQKASEYFGIQNVNSFSGGTEATAFYSTAVKAIVNCGFVVEAFEEGNNPVYKVYYSASELPIINFSKKYDDDFNPQNNFIAIMVCSSANEACPVVNGADKKIAIEYRDPKEADGTEYEEDKYNERCAQIAREMLFTFSLVN